MARLGRGVDRLPVRGRGGRHLEPGGVALLREGCRRRREAPGRPREGGLERGGQDRLVPFPARVRGRAGSRRTPEGGGRRGVRDRAVPLVALLAARADRLAPPPPGGSGGGRSTGQPEEPP